MLKLVEKKKKKRKTKKRKKKKKKIETTLAYRNNPYFLRLRRFPGARFQLPLSRHQALSIGREYHPLRSAPRFRDFLIPMVLREPVWSPTSTRIIRASLSGDIDSPTDR